MGNVSGVNLPQAKFTSLGVTSPFLLIGSAAGVLSVIAWLQQLYCLCQGVVAFLLPQMTSVIATAWQLANYLSVVVVICGGLILVKMQVQAFRMDHQIERGAVHRTQKEDERFHREFWSKFDGGATVLVVGCLALSLTLNSGGALKTGL